MVYNNNYDDDNNNNNNNKNNNTNNNNNIVIDNVYVDSRPISAHGVFLIHSALH